MKYLTGKILHEDGDSIFIEDGDRVWLLNGRPHREDGPAVIRQNGKFKAWYHNGKKHRLDGPAITYENEYELWCENGEYHREDGPAVLTYVKDSDTSWYIRGNQIYNYEDFQKMTGHSDQYIMYLKLKYGEMI